MKQNISNGMIIKDVHGEALPGKTFRVLKEKEIRAHGEYRTKRLVLEAWDALEKSQKPSSTNTQAD